MRNKMYKNKWILWWLSSLNLDRSISFVLSLLLPAILLNTPIRVIYIETISHESETITDVNSFRNGIGIHWNFWSFINSIFLVCCKCASGVYLSVRTDLPFVCNVIIIFITITAVEFVPSSDDDSKIDWPEILYENCT